MTHYDCAIIGAGAAGMMCGAWAGRRGRSVLLLDHADTPGEKIRISGGGRCNFTNIHCGPDNFISQNPHFCRSALSRYSPYDFIDLVERYGISWHEKTKGQLFCDGRSQQIIDMLLSECEAATNQIWLGTQVLDIRPMDDGGFILTTDRQSLSCESLVIASGGPSMTFTGELKEPLKALSGVSVQARVTHESTTFEDALLFTHRGLSGPAILQISSYWRAGDAIHRAGTYPYGQHNIYPSVLPV